MDMPSNTEFSNTCLAPAIKGREDENIYRVVNVIHMIKEQADLEFKKGDERGSDGLGKPAGLACR